MKNLFSLMALVLFTISAIGQSEIKKEAIVKSGDVTKHIWISSDGDNQKTIKVNVENENGKRSIKIVTNEDGDEKVIEWTDEGEIPDEIKEKLEREGISISILDGSDGDDANVFEIEGDMSNEIKKIIKECKIILSDLKDGEGEKTIIIKKTKSNSKFRGPREARKMREWYGLKRGDFSGQERRIFRLHEGKERGNAFFFSDDDVADLSDAYMGAHIKTADDGVEIIDLIKDSPADKANFKVGDVIQQINGANTKSVDNLMTLLGMFDPNDQVEVTFLRDGKTKTQKMTLGTRPDHQK